MMEKNKPFALLCEETHSLINDYLNQVGVLKPEINASISILVEERLSAYEFILRLRLDFQPLFINEVVVDELWDDIRSNNTVQEMITATTLKLMSHIDPKFHHNVATTLGLAVSEMVEHQGSLDADFHERMVVPEEMVHLVTTNPWFATVLLITMGRAEYVKPDFLGLV